MGPDDAGLLAAADEYARVTRENVRDLARLPLRRLSRLANLIEAERRLDEAFCHVIEVALRVDAGTP